MNRETLSLPMVALRGLSILPEMVRHFDVSRPKSIQAIEEAMLGEIGRASCRERVSSPV